MFGAALSRVNDYLFLTIVRAHTCAFFPYSLLGDLQGLWTPYRFDWHREEDQATSPLDSLVTVADTFSWYLRYYNHNSSSVTSSEGKYRQTGALSCTCSVGAGEAGRSTDSWGTTSLMTGQMALQGISMTVIWNYPNGFVKT